MNMPRTISILNLLTAADNNVPSTTIVRRGCRIVPIKPHIAHTMLKDGTARNVSVAVLFAHRADAS